MDNSNNGAGILESSAETEVTEENNTSQKVDTEIFKSREFRNTFPSTNLTSKVTYSGSGLKSTFHGIVYQLKLLILYAWIGRNNGYKFRLATEMDDAEKFDDVVFYFIKPNETKENCKLVQAKHIQDEKNTRISGKDLLDKPDGRFSLYKYYESHRKIKQNDKFKNVACDYILCTNIGLNLDRKYDISKNIFKIVDQELYFEPVINSSDVFNNKDGEQYRFVKKCSLDERQKVLDTIITSFDDQSDLKKLCKALVECIVEEKPIPLDKDPFTKYNVALQQHILNVCDGTLWQDFIAKRSQDCAFRKEFREAFLQYKEKTRSKQSKLKYSETILKNCLIELAEPPPSKKQKVDIPIKIKEGIIKIPYRDPYFINVGNYSSKFADKFIKTKTKTISVRQGKIKGDNEIYAELDNLRGHVLVYVNKDIKFSDRFLNNQQLPYGVAQFRDSLLAILKNHAKFDVSKLSEYTFSIRNYTTYAETEVDDLLNNFQSLPISLSVEEIDDFLDDLILSVNQPNVDRLNLLIAAQIAKEFNLVDTDLISHEFLNSFVNWMKEKQGVENRFISDEDNIFDQVANKIAQLITVGPTCEMVRKINELKLGFHNNEVSQTLTKFMERDDPEKPREEPSLLCICTPHKLTHLGSVSVLQTLSMQNPKLKPGSYIFLRLTNWLHLLNEVNYALGQVSITLMIIEFRFSEKLLEYDQISYRLNQLLQKKKAFIFIIESDFIDLFNITDKFATVDFKPEFYKFDEMAKSSLLKTEVYFQGSSCPLSRIIGNQFDLIDLALITKLTNTETVDIGTLLWNFSGYDEDYYVSRKFTRQIILDPVLLIEYRGHDIYAIIDKTEENSDIFDQVLIEHFTNRHHAKIIEINDKHQFQVLCDENKKSNVHLLKCHNGMLVWRQSKGSICELMPYVVHEKNVTNIETIYPEQSEEDFITSRDNGNNIVLVSNEAGMGKSTVLSSLTHKIRKIMHMNTWLVRLDLNDYTKVLFEEQQTYKLNSLDDAITFIIEKMLFYKSHLQLRTSFEKKIFKHYLKVSGNIIFMVDGVDEISPNYEKLILKLLILLGQSKADKIFVTTRPHIRRIIEEKLGVFSYKMIPFTFENQQEFLRKYLCKKLDIDILDDANDYFIVCINGLIKKLHDSISDRERTFMGIPLQMRMIAKIFLAQIDKEKMEESCQHFVESFHTDLIKLYSEFIKIIIYEVYWTEKKSIDFSKTGTSELMDLNYRIFFQYYQDLAVFSLFTEKERYQLNFFANFESLQKNSEIGIRNVGLIEYVADKPHFIHRSFAEYFVASYIINRLLILRENDDCVLIVTQIFCKPQFQVVRAFLNNLLIKEKISADLVAPILIKKIIQIWESNPDDICDNAGNTLFHSAAAEGNKAIMEFLGAHKEINQIYCNLINVPNKRGETILHLAILKGYVDIVQYICSLRSTPDNNCIIDVRKFDIHSKTALYLATSREHWDIVKWLIENLPAAQNELQDSDKDHCIVHIVAKRGNLEMIRYLEEKGSDLSVNDNNQRSILHIAISGNHFPVVQWLLSEDRFKSMVKHMDKNKRTPLMLAVLLGQQNTIELLLSKSNIGINDEINAQGRTLMHIAAISNNIKFVQWFMDVKKGDIKKADKLGITPMHIAANCGYLEPFKLLYVKYLENNDTDLYTLLQSLTRIASVADKIDIVQWLMEQCEGRFNKTRILEPLLQQAGAHNQLEQLMWLFSHGVNVNATNEKGRTALHYLVRAGQRNQIKWLIDHGANINAVDNEKRSVLHSAVDAGNSDIIQLLLDCKADMSVRDQNGVSIFHLAAKSGRPPAIQLLCRQPDAKDYFSMRDNNHNTLLHYAALQMRLEHFIWVLENMDNYGVDAQNIFGRSVLHNACFKGSTILVQYLLGKTVLYHKKLITIETSANIDLKCKQDRSILHSAAISGNLDIVKWLMEEKKVVIQNSLEINYAARYDHLCVVEYLARSQKVDMHASGPDGRTLLHMATLRMQRATVIEWLFANYPDIDVNKKDSNERAPILVGASFRNWDAVKALLKHPKIDVNTSDRQKWTLLHVTTRCGKFELLKDLIEKRGAKDDVIDIDGRTLLHSAARSGSLKIMKYLCNERGLQVTLDSNNCTLLHGAGRSGNIELCEWLLTERITAIESKDITNRTVLHYACHSGKLDLVKYLVQQNADPLVVDTNGVSIVHEAAFSGNSSLVEWLVRDQNVQILSTDNDGNTIMHCAAKFGHVHIVEWCVMQGVDINMNTDAAVKAGTVLHEACRYGQWYSARFILQNGGIKSASAIDIDGRTPMDIANEKNHVAIIDLLGNISEIIP